MKSDFMAEYQSKDKCRKDNKPKNRRKNRLDLFIAVSTLHY